MKKLEVCNPTSGEITFRMASMATSTGTPGTDNAFLAWDTSLAPNEVWRWKGEVPLAVFEPGRRDRTGHGDALHGFEVWKFLYFEDQPPGFQLRNLVLDIIRPPPSLGEMSGRGSTGREELEPGILLCLIDCR